MESINSEKWRVRLAIVAIFLLGFVAGGLAVNLYRQGKPGAPQAKGPQSQHHPGIEAMLKTLNLSDQQKQQVDQILSDTRQRFEEIRRASQPQMEEMKKQTRERLKTVLTEDQWNQFQQQIKEREARQDRTQDRPHRRPFLQDAQESPSPQQ
jgi:Spy/CpxP family protein refolding chaperone